MKSTRIALTFAALAALLPGQTKPETQYVQAYYTKWNPGMAEEGRQFLSTVANKYATARTKADPAYLGQVRLYRVFPAGGEAGHDILRLVFRATPPDFAATSASAAYLASTGLTPDEYRRKINAINTTVKTEIWTSVFRHGTIHEGDFFRVSFADPPQADTAEYTAFQRDYSSGMSEEIVRRGVLQAWDQWRLLFTPNAAPYNFVSYTVHKDAASLYRSLPSQTEIFAAAHPKGSYNRYIARSRELANTVKTVIYRVDSVIWK